MVDMLSIAVRNARFALVGLVIVMAGCGGGANGPSVDGSKSPREQLSSYWGKSGTAKAMERYVNNICPAGVRTIDDNSGYYTDDLIYVICENGQVFVYGGDD